MNLISRLEQEFSIKYNTQNILSSLSAKHIMGIIIMREKEKKNINVQQDFYAGGTEIYSACLLK